MKRHDWKILRVVQFTPSELDSIKLAQMDTGKFASRFYHDAIVDYCNALLEAKKKEVKQDEDC